LSLNKNGHLVFNGFINAGEKYRISSTVDILSDDEKSKNWNNILNNKDSTEEDLLITCLEIFDWGGVLRGNVTKLVGLYKSKILKNTIQNVREFLKSHETIKSGDVLMSSGWTKVYSFMGDNIVIYDSRVSAFLNHTLTFEIEYNSEQKELFKELVKYLFNFEGNTENRERLVDKKMGFINAQPSDLKGFNANLIASWIIEFLKSELQLKEDYRVLERAFFMLGFDLEKIK
jgi:hypothetical protein